MKYSKILKKMPQIRNRLIQIIGLIVFLIILSIAISYFVKYTKLSLEYNKTLMLFQRSYMEDDNTDYQYYSFYNTIKFIVDEHKKGNDYYLDTINSAAKSTNRDYILFKRFGLIERSYFDFNFLTDSLEELKLELNNLIVSEIHKREIIDFFSKYKDDVKYNQYYDGFYGDFALDSEPKINNKRIEDYIIDGFWNKSVVRKNIKTRIGVFIDIPKSGNIKGEIFIKSGTNLDSLLLNFIKKLPQIKPGMIDGKAVDRRIELYLNNSDVSGPVI